MTFGDSILIFDVISLSLQLTFVCGLILIGASCIWLWFLHDRNKKQVFGAAIFMGSGSATLLVTSLSMVADLIGEHTVSKSGILGWSYVSM